MVLSGVLDVMKEDLFMKELTRRGFLGTAAAGLAGAGVLMSSGCAPSTPASAGAEDELAATGAPASDWLGEPPTISEDEIVGQIDTELLVIGAGNVGLTAAVHGCQNGLDVVLCEKTTGHGHTPGWIGAVNTKYHEQAGITVDKGKLLNEAVRYASGKCDQSVWNVWINESAAMIEWLEDFMKPQGGYTMLDTEGYGDPTGGTDYYVQPLEHTLYTANGELIAEQRGDFYEEYLNSQGVEISYEHCLVKLIREGEKEGRVTGGIFQTPEGYVQVNASKGVLLATGGYAANPTMVRALNPVIPACVTGTSFLPSLTGDGIKAGMWVGAKKDLEPAAMIFDRGVVPNGVDAGYTDDGPDAAFPGNTTFMIGSQPVLKVNRRGKRFANESCPYDFMTHAATHQPGGVYALVFDSGLWDDFKRFHTIGCSKFLGTYWLEPNNGDIDAAFAQEIEQGLMQRADTIEELADQLGFTGSDKDNFLAEVERYNELYDKQVDEDFGKEAYRLSEIRRPPYYGAWNGGLLLTTIDGLCINSDMQVLDESNEVIEGLYAAGDCQGSMFSGNYPEYIVGCANGRGITFALHAVKHIAGLI